MRHRPSPQPSPGHTGRGGQRVAVIAIVAALLFAALTRADPPTPEKIDAAIKKGVAFLYTQQSADGTWEIIPAPPPGPLKKQPDDTHASDENNQFGGRTALAVYALLEAGESPTEPKLAKAIAFLRDTPSISIYVLCLRCQVWADLPPTSENKAALRRDATALLNGKKMTKAKNLVWDWAIFDPLRPDWAYHLNNVQYAATGLWYAADAGYEVPPDIWKQIDKTFEAGQLPDGGWTRIILTPKDKQTAPTMFNTATGVASLFQAQDYSRSDLYATPRGNVSNPVTEKGVQWVADHFVPTITDYKTPGYESVNRRWYGIGMAALASGRRRLGTHDWYAEGAESFLRAQNKAGNWGTEGVAGNFRVVDTGWALLFLKRGRVPVAMSKLDYSPGAADAKKALWNQRPRDAANLVQWVSRATERELTWQTVDTNDSADALLESPVLYLAGGDALQLNADAKAKLKTYAEQGGLIFAVADAANAAFARSVEKLGTELFADSEWRDVPDGHPIFATQVYKRSQFKSKPQLRALGNGVREYIVLAPAGDPAKTWQLKSGRVNADAWQLAADVLSYAVDKDHFFSRGTTWRVPETPIKAHHTITVGRLKYAGPWDPEPAAWPSLERYGTARDWTVKATTIEAGSPVTGVDALHVTGTRAFTFDEPTRTAIKTYLDGGGRIFFEAAGGNDAFTASARAELTRWYGADAVKPLPPDHTLLGDKFKVAYRTYRPAGGDTPTGPQLFAVETGGRVVALLSGQDISAGLVGVPTDGIVGYTPETARILMLRILTRWK